MIKLLALVMLVTCANAAQLRGECTVYEDPTTGKTYCGQWVSVHATAYSPEDELDSEYRSQKGVDLYKTSHRVDIRTTPYNIAVPYTRENDVSKRKPLFVKYGTKVIIPRGYGYLDNVRANDRVFTADDTGGRITAKTIKSGVPYIDLRYMEEKDAIKFGRERGVVNIRVFVIKQEITPLCPDALLSTPSPSPAYPVYASTPLTPASFVVGYPMTAASLPSQSPKTELTNSDTPDSFTMTRDAWIQVCSLLTFFVASLRFTFLLTSRRTVGSRQTS